MKPIRHRHESRHSAVFIALPLLALLALGGVGCARRAGIEVIPWSSRDVLDISSDDIVQVMRRAGFSDKQIIEFGTEVRDGLAESGAVQIKINNKWEVVFAIKGDYVYVSTRLRGNFIYNVKTGWVSG